MSHHWQEDRLRHSWRDGRLRYEATAEGYAHLIAAALALRAVTPGGDHSHQAAKLADAMIAKLWDESAAPLLSPPKKHGSSSATYRP